MLNRVVGYSIYNEVGAFLLERVEGYVKIILKEKLSSL